MSFPRYPKYKASGVEWLGEVPEGWAISSLKHSVKDIYSGGTPETGNPEYWAVDEDDSIPWVAIGDMTRAAVVDRTEKQITRAGLASKRLRVLPKGTLLYSMYASLGKVAVLSEPATINQAILGIIPDSKKLAQNFLRYWLIQIERHLSLFSSSNTQDNLNAGKVRSLPLLIPNSEEQTAIAEFLDRETGKIDELVAEQRRLMELLKEKRQAVISHAVTKGLNPHAPMKPSCIEWLGDVPAGWKIKRVKRLIAILTDYTANGSFASLAENVTYLSAGPSRLVRLTDLREDLKNEGLYVGDDAHAFLAKSELFGGEVLVANVGAYAGYACLMPSGKGKATLGPNMYLIRFRSETISNEYGLLCLMSVGVQEQLKLASTSTAQPKLNKDDVKECVTVIPPTLEEQAEVLSYIKARSLEFDTLTAEAQRAIDLLQERRTALISAAVTGQIDVRKEVT